MRHQSIDRLFGVEAALRELFRDVVREELRYLRAEVLGRLEEQGRPAPPLGPDGNLWFTETSGSNLGRVNSAGAITEFSVPTSSYGIATGPDGNLWFTEQQAAKIGRFVPP